MSPNSHIPLHAVVQTHDVMQSAVRGVNGDIAGTRRCRICSARSGIFFRRVISG